MGEECSSFPLASMAIIRPVAEGVRLCDNAEWRGMRGCAGGGIDLATFALGYDAAERRRDFASADLGLPSSYNSHRLPLQTYSDARL